MSFAAFVYVTYEMFAVGLIRPMAQDLGVTEGQIGLLMSVYAGLVAVVTIPLMHFTRNWDRRPVFLATLGFLAGGVILQGRSRTATRCSSLRALPRRLRTGCSGPSSTRWRHASRRRG